MDSDYLKTARRLHRLVETQIDALEKMAGDKLLAVEDISRMETLVKIIAILAEKIKPSSSGRRPLGKRIKSEDLLRYASDDDNDPVG